MNCSGSGTMHDPASTSRCSMHRAATIAESVRRKEPGGDRPGRFHGFLKRQVLNRLGRLATGCLTVNDAGEEHRFGHETGDAPSGTLTVESPAFYRRVAFGGALGFAESYLLGDWTSDSPTDVVRVFCRNLDVTDSVDRGIVRVLKRLARRWHERHENSSHGSLKNIRAHYDLGNDFYRLFLDESMTYSCAVFESAESTLEEAQTAKVDRICRKLDLRETDHLVEIGTGWGALAIHAARNYGCHVTTTTISEEQYDFAAARIQAAGLCDRITLLQKDYRELNGRFDKLVSVEMIEAVGNEYLETFLRKCCDLLKPEGQMVLQGITISEQRYERYLSGVDFIQRYVFPGGCLISTSRVMESVASVTDMRLLHLEDLAPHYARTLRCWRDRFTSRLDDVRAMGYPEPFIRLWDYYLSYCEAAFLERHVGTVQLQFARPRCQADALTPFL